ncbi:MAG TPA: hypothetical protein VN699_06935 [Pirellulales bacterium]|nr:hypothetical protein [Pirellulales bacterium]
MPRPQFSIRTLLWLTLVVAAFLGGTGFERDRLRREWARNGIWLDLGASVADGGDFEVSVVRPGQLSLSRRSLFSLNSTLWGVALAAAFLGGHGASAEAIEREAPAHASAR